MKKIFLFMIKYLVIVFMCLCAVGDLPAASGRGPAKIDDYSVSKFTRKFKKLKNRSKRKVRRRKKVRKKRHHRRRRRGYRKTPRHKRKRLRKAKKNSSSKHKELTRRQRLHMRKASASKTY